MNYQNLILSKLAARTARVGIIGLGYVGLPLATVFAGAGYRVLGIDLDARKVDALNRGESYIPDVPAGLVAGLVARGLLSATADYSALADLDAVSICVPTPLRKTHDPDMSYIIGAADQIAGIPHVVFLSRLADYGVDAFCLTEDELE